MPIGSSALGTAAGPAKPTRATRASLESAVGLSWNPSGGVAPDIERVRRARARGAASLLAIASGRFKGFG
eukprot:2956167-Lingulodinium_polyedra.AAC.1